MAGAEFHIIFWELSSQTGALSPPGRTLQDRDGGRLEIFVENRVKGVVHLKSSVNYTRHRINGDLGIVFCRIPKPII